MNDGDRNRSWPDAVASVVSDVCLVALFITMGQMAGCLPWWSA